jgi:hypothetical protein
MDLKERDFEDGRWPELSQDSIERRALVLAVFNLRFLLQECLVICQKGKTTYSA